jgi:hypothetical protein
MHLTAESQLPGQAVSVIVGIWRGQDSLRLSSFASFFRQVSSFWVAGDVQSGLESRAGSHRTSELQTANDFDAIHVFDHHR